MKHVIALFVLIIIMPACKKVDTDVINLNNNQISALGHGGMGIGHTYPLNSFESILNCLNLGADGTEIDVQMTTDSVLVAFHDETLEDATNKSGRIFTKKWSEINNATYTNPPYTNYRVITLDELFSNIADPTAFTFFLDCKNFNPDGSSTYLNTFNNALIKIIDKYNLANTVFVEFKRTDLIQSLKNKRPDLNIFVFSDFDSGLERVNQFQLQGITIAVNNISNDEVKIAHDNGTMIAVFNTHSQNRNIDAIEKQVDFIQSDKVKHLLKILK